MVGQTETGKSTLARVLHTSAAPPSLAVDPLASECLARIPRVVTFSDPLNWPDSESGRWRFVPRDPFDLDAYDAAYATVLNRLATGEWRNAHVLTDEAGVVLPVHRRNQPAGPYKRYRGAARQYLYRAAKLMGGHIACHTRPVEVDMHVRTDAQHNFVFYVDPEDVDEMARRCGVTTDQLAALLGELQPKGFLWVNKTSQPRRVTVCPPLAL